MLLVFFVSCSLFCFFFFKQKTAYEMRISDWSSDVCSSDLNPAHGPQNRPPRFVQCSCRSPFFCSGRLSNPAIAALFKLKCELAATGSDNAAAGQYVHKIGDRKSTRLNSSH